MDEKASEILGEPVIAGVTLEAKQSIADVMGGAIGGALGKAVAGIVLKPAATPGDHKGIHYVAVGPTKVGFFSMKRGLFKPSLDTLLVEHARRDVEAVELERGMMTTAHFVFQDGTHYVLMCPGIHRGKLKRVKAALTDG